MNKPQRWYETEGQTLYVYDAPWRDFSFSVSIVSIDDLPFYSRNFELRKIWGSGPSQHNTTEGNRYGHQTSHT